MATTAPDRQADSLRYSYGRQQVPSARNVGTPYADTLDTGNPAVKVVLYNNGTYKYVKDPKAVQSDEIFSDHWDTRSPTGTPVYAAFDGKVRISDWVGGYGNLIVIRHPNGLETCYGHLSRRDVSSGDWVSAGDVIGLGGSTGRSSGPHLHFETRYKGAAFDPSWLIDFETGTLRHRLLKIRSWYFNPNQRYVQAVDDEDEIFRTDEEDRLAAEEQAKKDAAARAAAEAAAMKWHTIKSGDTLSGIARKYHTTVRELCRLNSMKESSILRVGKKIRVR